MPSLLIILEDIIAMYWTNMTKIIKVWNSKQVQTVFVHRECTVPAAYNLSSSTSVTKDFAPKELYGKFLPGYS